MLKKIVGIFMIAVGVTAAVTGCSTTVDTGVATAGTPAGAENASIGATANADDATVEPTAKISHATELPAPAVTTAPFETTRATIQAIRDANLSNPTPTLAPTPVDKSGWTIIKPGECNAGATGDADTEEAIGEIVEPNRLIITFVELIRASDESDLVNMAELVVHGLPTGDIEVEPPRRLGDWSRYFQDFRIVGVLRGQSPGDTIRVLQVGYDLAIRQEYLEKYKIGLAPGDDYDFPGPLAQCPQILFLNNPVAGVFTSVGVSQGIFLLGPGGRIVSAPDFETFVGMDVAQLKARIEALSQR